jgi:hypothetical protein
MSKPALAVQSPFARQIVMTAVSAAVINMHQAHATDDRAEWFNHILRRCEAKAATIAEQAALRPEACGDATFIEVFAKTLPALFTAALDAHEQAMERTRP